MIQPSIAKHMNAMIDKFKTHPILRVYIFGSSISDTFNNESDLDLLLEFPENIDPLERGEAILSIQEQIEDIVKRSVDVVSLKAIKNPYFLSSIQKNSILIYEG